VESKRKILAVDDEPRNLKILQLSLGNAWEIKTAAHGEEALEVLKTFIPDLILLDIMMPGVDGYEVCSRIRANPDLALTKVILISGKAMIEERLKGYEVGADDYITKPFIPEELLAKVKVFIRLTQVEKELKVFNQSLEEQVQLRTRQLVETEAKLIYSVKMSALGEMAGGIAHEINTPLASIFMNSELLEDDLKDQKIDDVQIHKRIQDIKRVSERIAKIINGLRSFSRDGSNDSVEPVSVKSLIEDTLVFCQDKINTQGIKLSLAVIAPDLTLSCRATQISQVLLNLLNNARDAVENLSEKCIEIECHEFSGKLHISIIDNGQGVPIDIADKIMQPFFTTKDIGKGTGLGLSISKGLVESHQGELVFERVGEKTRFCIMLPMRQQLRVAS